ncbi:MAG: hypothetical protein JO340_10025 [Acidobacteriaceae bacterium]|nr:hypothetical protein [Acidobacteriaceae bacterium]
MNETIREKRKSDPLIGPKLAGHALAQILISRLKDERGVHIETLLCALGSLAGYSCQASVRELLVKQGGEPEEKIFVIANGKDGKKYFFGDALNKPLAEDRYSVWSLAAGIAANLGCGQPVKLEEIFKHVAATVGGPEFGIPRIPEDHRPADPPSNWVKHGWPKALATVQEYCESPSEWPAAFGIAIQESMTQAKGVIDPCLALSIVMECAIPMSKVDAATL